MFGVLEGLRATMRHIVRPSARVTRKYPYERRELPERSRGLIALLLEPETNIFRCESCLMCEKACPPRAITISYRFRNGFRKRPPLAPRAAYYRMRMVEAAPYGDRRPLGPAVITVPEEVEVGAFDPEPVRRILRETPASEDRLIQVLRKTADAYGYLPWSACRIVAQEFSLTMTALYTAASMLPNFRGAPPGEGTPFPRGERFYTGNLGIAGLWPEVTPPPSHEEAHPGIDELALARR
ncbi:MAG TPA: hypothetical protein VFA01_00610 [Candidatus Dormibacteraeota bacterium]|nr:hypothetical protein [Candidatus Dormibacteraeota bacterium]